MIYNPGMLRKTLAEYQRRAQGARMRAPDDVLVSRPPPLEEAPWANTSCLWSDIEQAMRALPFQHEKIVWEVVCKGESSSRNGTKRYDWRRQVAGWWGITPGDVNKAVDSALEEMCDWLNDADTVNEHSPLIEVAPDSRNGIAVDNR
jgi:hypothetical protein